MQNIASLNANDRAEIIQATAVKFGLSPTIVEKDYWICLTLDYLFSRSPAKDQIAFKGGTSLTPTIPRPYAFATRRDSLTLSSCRKSVSRPAQCQLGLQQRS